MTDQNVFLLCDYLSEAAAVLDDYECGTGTSSEVVVRLQRLLSDEDLLHALHAVGYLPPATPPRPTAKHRRRLH